MCRRKQRCAFDQVSEFDRGRVVAYRDCGLSFREIGSRVARNQITVMRYANCAHGRDGLLSHITNRSTAYWSVTHHSVSARTIRRCLQQTGLSARRPVLGLLLSQNDRRLPRQWCDERRMGGKWNKLCLLMSHASVCKTTMVGFESGDTVGKGC
ncbi:transposable element Tc1 transposase [Trichonephila clavipes]|nr:transposable element Tc1 transposase [Trichonephila clavipes]